MKSKEGAEELVRAAFAQAQRKSGPQAKTMTLAVLNNRLLQITDRRFRPQDFGVKDIKGLVALLAPKFRLTGEPHLLSVELVAPIEADNSSADTTKHELFFRNKQGLVIEDAVLPAGSVESDKKGVEDELIAARDRGDSFTIGEILACRLPQACGEELDILLAKVTCAWADTRDTIQNIQSLNELAGRIETFSAQSLASAFVNALARVDSSEYELSDAVRDFAYRLREDIATVFGVEKRSPLDTCRAALITLRDCVSEATASVSRFLRTTPVTAKAASIDVIKCTNRLQPYLVPAERQFLRELGGLIGPAFRKFCETYERSEDAEVIRRAPEILENVAMQRLDKDDPRRQSGIWNSLVQPVLEHVKSIVDNAMSRGEIALAPALTLRNPITKADLRSASSELSLSFSLTNRGRGHAHDVSLRQPNGDSKIQLALLEPAGSFDVPPNAEQVVRLHLVLEAPCDVLDIPIEWVCQTSVGKQSIFADRLEVSQQVTEPDWDALLASPPYSLNPIKRPDQLYRRDSSLHKLRLAAMAGASTFVWDQKRIGKTSLLQVLAAELSIRLDFSCIFLRMGELVSLHEGQIAHLIAERLVQKVSYPIPVPSEAEFGAGLSKLIPFMEAIVAANAEHKFLGPVRA